MTRSFSATLLAAILVASLLSACSRDVESSVGAARTEAATSATPAVSVTRTLASGLEVPWGVAFLSDGSALVALRNSGQVRRVTAAGSVTDAGSVPGAEHRGEGGLLGLAAAAAGGTTGRVTVYAYFTGAEDNRIVAMPYENGRLGTPTPILTGIPSAGFHNGGRMIIGPDGMLWVGTGDAGITSNAQDRASLGGKILRLNLDGTVPVDNPFPGSPVWSLGHRNVQGLAFDSRGRLWASEFGQNRWDELNLVERGANYGWPQVEGEGPVGGEFEEPFAVWPTSEASPSGLAIVDDVAYLAGLRGERLWQVPLTGDGDDAVARFDGQFGRLRTVLTAPDGTLWLTTSNRDGRGSPAGDDDRILEVTIG
jgi:glucose/arabinose dehydrogenase